MHSNNTILHDLGHLLRVHNDGRVERLELSPPVPAGLDPATGVDSKDVRIYPDRGVSARLYKPSKLDNNERLPVVVFYHGGGFCVQSAFGALYHDYLNCLADQAGALVVSIEYRLAPEWPVPACYDDCWDVLRWVVGHMDGNGDHLVGSSFSPDPWLTDNADFTRIFLAGDSAGANIAHHVALKVGTKGLSTPKGSIHTIKGIILSQPYFWGKDRIGDEADKLTHFPNPRFVDLVWEVVCPDSSDLDDPWINPTRDPDLKYLGSERVIVFVAEKDVLRYRGWLYKEALEKSGWCGKVEVVESFGEDHVFHLYKPSCEKAVDMMNKIVYFINSS